MGYVHNTHMSQIIPPWMWGKSAGTWTPTLSSNVASDNRSAADANFNLFIPIMVPSNSVALQGARLESVDVWYEIATAAADDVATVELEKHTLPASGSAVTGAAVTISIDAGHDTAAERKATANVHKMTVTITSPEWVDDDTYYVLYIAVDAASTTVWKNICARANFTLRI